MKGSEEWVTPKGLCSVLNLITLQCSYKWKAVSESWGHWEVTDWHVGWHHSNGSIPRRIAGFNRKKSAVKNHPITLEGEMLFLHTVSLALHENLMKLLAMLTGCLDQPVNLFTTWPPRALQSGRGSDLRGLMGSEDRFTAPPSFLLSQSVIWKRDVRSPSDVSGSSGCHLF